MKKNHYSGLMNKLQNTFDTVSKAIEHAGEQSVLDTVSEITSTLFNSVADLQDNLRSYNIPTLNEIDNALKNLLPQKTRKNKYAEFSQIGKNADLSLPAPFDDLDR